MPYPPADIAGDNLFGLNLLLPFGKTRVKVC